MESCVSATHIHVRYCYIYISKDLVRSFFFIYILGYDTPSVLLRRINKPKLDVASSWQSEIGSRPIEMLPPKGKVPIFS